jgi:nucleoid-associated protein YgaU
MACARSYEVKSGDTLFIIAQKELGDGNRWKEITDVNGTSFGSLGDNPVIRVGDVICLPKA